MFPLIPPRPPLPTITVSHSYKGLNSSTLQTISDYKLLSTSAQGTSVQGCVRERGICTAQVLQLTTEVSLNPSSSGIITSFRYSKGAVHTLWSRRGTFGYSSPENITQKLAASAAAPEFISADVKVTYMCRFCL